MVTSPLGTELPAMVAALYWPLFVTILTDSACRKEVFLVR